MGIIEFFNNWLAERRKDRECKGCNAWKQANEMLQIQLEAANIERTMLIKQLVGKNIDPVVEQPEEEYKPLPPKGRRFFPSAVRQQMMEQNDRVTLDLMRKKKLEMVNKST